MICCTYAYIPYSTVYLKPQILTCPRNIELMSSEVDGQSEGYVYIRNGTSETVFHTDKYNGTVQLVTFIPSQLQRSSNCDEYVRRDRWNNLQMWPLALTGLCIPTRCTNFANLFLAWNSTCFGQFLCSSSGVYSLYTRQWYMSHRFVDSFRAGSG